MTQKNYLFTPIVKDVIKEGETLPYSIYRQVDEKLFSLILKKEQLLDPTLDLSFLRDSTPIYIKSSERRHYQQYIQKNISEILDDVQIDLDSKATLINHIATETMNDLFESDVTSENLVKIDTVINNTIKLMLSEYKALYSMLKVTSYDYYTYTHCIDVATYAIAFGIYLKFDQEDLEVLGKAAMLHDLGKKEIASDIITKNAKLTQEEFEIVKSHPSHSVNILKELGEENDQLLLAIEQHHEKCNGEGYPMGLKADEICEFAKIVSICDVFNALTTRRTYKDRMSSFSAFEIMCSEMKHDLSKEHLLQFIKFMGYHKI